MVGWTAFVVGLILGAIIGAGFMSLIIAGKPSDASSLNGGNGKKKQQS